MSQCPDVPVSQSNGGAQINAKILGQPEGRMGRGSYRGGNHIKICFPFLRSVTSALLFSVTKYRSDFVLYSRQAGGFLLSSNMNISFVGFLTMEIYSKH